MTAGVYVLHSLMWSGAGFVLGWLLGHLGREVSAMTQFRTGTNGNSAARAARPQWLNYFGLERVIGLVVVVLATITMVVAVSVNSRLERVISCQAQFNSEYGAALTERTQAADQERAAQRKLLVTILSAPPSDPPTRAALSRQAMSEYINALNSADSRRNQNPLPHQRQCM